MTTVRDLRNTHKELMELKEQLRTKEENLSAGNYAEIREITHKINAKQHQVDAYNELFVMNLTDFVEAFRDVSIYWRLTDVELVAKNTATRQWTCERHTDSQQKSYTIPIEYGLSVRNCNDKGKASKPHYIKLLDSEFYLVTNYDEEKADVEIARIESGALNPKRLKNIRMNLLTNRDLHVANYRNPAECHAFGEMNSDDILWRTFESRINRISRERKAEISAKIDSLEDEKTVFANRDINSLLRDNDANGFSMSPDNKPCEMTRQ